VLRNKYLERRRHKRHAVSAFIFSRKVAGRAINISEGGMAIKLFDNLEFIPDEWIIDFFCGTSAFVIKGLSLKLVHEENIKPSSFALQASQEVEAKFINLSAAQKEQIRAYISWLSKLKHQTNNTAILFNPH